MLYYFKLYALDTVLSIQEFSGKKELLRAMDGHIVESTTLASLYGK